MPDHRGKFSLTYEGPYVVKKAFSRGALILADMDGHNFDMPTNSDDVIQYFAWRILQVQPFFLHSTKKKQKNTKIWKGISKTQKGGLHKRKSSRELASLKTQKGGLGKLRQSKFVIVELLDDLILPYGGT